MLYEGQPTRKFSHLAGDKKREGLPGLSQLTILVLILGPALTQLLFLSEHHDLYLHTACDLVARVQDTEEYSVSYFLRVPPSFSQGIHELWTKLGRDLITKLSAELTARVRDMIQEHI